MAAIPQLNFFFLAGCGGDPARRPGDGEMDYDNIPDQEDNCPEKSNPDQADEDGDGIGDECDNCKYVSNYDQKNLENDSHGDACDVCPRLWSNSFKRDDDHDGIGDECGDDDWDNDGVDNSEDNCSVDWTPEDGYNPKQEDFDGDGIGDLCENGDQTLSIHACPEIGINASGNLVTSAHHLTGTRNALRGVVTAERSIIISTYPAFSSTEPENEITVRSVDLTLPESEPNPGVFLCKGKTSLDLNDNNEILTCWTESMVLYCRIYDFNSGDALAEQITVAETEEHFSVGFSNEGRFAVTWDNEEVGRVYARLFETDGDPVGSVFASDGDHPDIAMRDNGSFAVSWNGPSGVMLQKFTSAAVRIGDEMLVDYNASDSSHPGLAWNNAGDLAVIYQAGGTYADINFTSRTGAQTSISVRDESSDGPLFTDNVFTFQPFNYYAFLNETGRLAWGAYQLMGFQTGNWYIAELDSVTVGEAILLNTGTCAPPCSSLVNFALDANDSNLVSAIFSDRDVRPRIDIQTDWIEPSP